jgi:hypothetical protein
MIQLGLINQEPFSASEAARLAVVMMDAILNVMFPEDRPPIDFTRFDEVCKIQWKRKIEMGWGGVRGKICLSLIMVYCRRRDRVKRLFTTIFWTHLC